MCGPIGDDIFYFILTLKLSLRAVPCRVAHLSSRFKQRERALRASTPKKQNGKNLFLEGMGGGGI